MSKKKFHSPQQSLFEETANSQEPVSPTADALDPSFDLVDALNAPVILFSEEWADVLPERFLKNIPIARLAAILQHKPLATYTECVLYIYTRTLLGPMDVHWTNIYTHISCQTLSELVRTGLLGSHGCAPHTQRLGAIKTLEPPPAHLRDQEGSVETTVEAGCKGRKVRTPAIEARTARGKRETRQKRKIHRKGPVRSALTILTSLLLLGLCQ
jgi:hypothetical protein